MTNTNPMTFWLILIHPSTHKAHQYSVHSDPKPPNFIDQSSYHPSLSLSLEVMTLKVSDNPFFLADVVARAHRDVDLTDFLGSGVGDFDDPDVDEFSFQLMHDQKFVCSM
jgi:hypothetical protein